MTSFDSFYELDESQVPPVPVIEIAYRHRESGRRTALRFRGVKLNYLFPIAPRDDADLAVVNNALLKHKPGRREPRMLEVRFNVGDGSQEVLFWLLASRTAEDRGTGSECFHWTEEGLLTPFLPAA